jgi:hypothetical protein
MEYYVLACIIIFIIFIIFIQMKPLKYKNYKNTVTIYDNGKAYYMNVDDFKILVEHLVELIESNIKNVRIDNCESLQHCILNCEESIFKWIESHRNDEFYYRGMEMLNNCDISDSELLKHTTQSEMIYGSKDDSYEPEPNKNINTARVKQKMMALAKSLKLFNQLLLQYPNKKHVYNIDPFKAYINYISEMYNLDELDKKDFLESGFQQTVTILVDLDMKMKKKYPDPYQKHLANSYNPNSFNPIYAQEYESSYDGVQDSENFIKKSLASKRHIKPPMYRHSLVEN